jgi:uncharacterized protein involved in exopolysaccharide biosynthesis
MMHPERVHSSATSAWDGQNGDLRRYVRIVSRWRLTIIGTTLLTVASALTLSWFQAPTYRATARVLPPLPQATGVLGGGIPQGNPERSQRNQIELFKSTAVRDAVRTDIGSAPRVEVSPVLNSDVLLVSAHDTRAERAALVANTYVKAYVDVQRQAEIQSLQEATRQTAAEMAELEKLRHAGQEPTTVTDQTAVLEHSLLADRKASLSNRLEERRRPASLQVASNRIVAAGGTCLIGPQLSRLQN